MPRETSHTLILKKAPPRRTSRGLKPSVLLILIVLLALLLQALPARLALADNSGEKPYAINPALPQAVQTFLRMETSDAVFNVQYRYAKITPASDGAYLQNVGSSRSNWYIEDQRYGSPDVIAGVLHENDALIRTGLKMFDFGFNREARNGSFPGSHGLFHGTAMFAAEAGPALLVLKSWTKEKSLGAATVKHVDWQISKLKKAVRYMVKSWYRKPGHIDDGGKEERFFEAAIALQSTGEMTSSKRLKGWASMYAREGMRMTQANGVWTENRGHDSTYQAIGLVYGTRYLMLVSGTSIYKSVYETVAKGEAWELSRVHKNGTMNRQGDDRTGPTCPERDGSGKCKTVDYSAIAGALMRWSVISGSQQYARAAYLTWLQNWERVPGDKLPKPGAFVKPGRLSLAQIHNGQWLTVWGTRFQPYETVKVYFAKTLEATITADDIGSFGGHSPVMNAHFPVPAGTGPGTYRIVEKGNYGTKRHTKVVITS
ncbi:MAG TPA: hypothetical protein VFB34_12285 [Chloroflexota bacterium]|nr:hypothetical protein [Chloroflexota bacterium]